VVGAWGKPGKEAVMKQIELRPPPPETATLQCGHKLRLQPNYFFVLMPNDESQGWVKTDKGWALPGAKLST
jgi:hypothetical protein